MPNIRRSSRISQKKVVKVVKCEKNISVNQVEGGNEDESKSECESNSKDVRLTNNQELKSSHSESEELISEKEEKDGHQPNKDKLIKDFKIKDSCNEHEENADSLTTNTSIKDTDNDNSLDIINDTDLDLNEMFLTLCGKETTSTTLSCSEKIKSLPGMSYVIIFTKAEKKENFLTFDCVLCSPSVGRILSGSVLLSHLRSRGHLLNLLKLHDYSLYEKYKPQRLVAFTILSSAVNKFEADTEKRIVIVTARTYIEERRKIASIISQLNEEGKKFHDNIVSATSSILQESLSPAVKYDIQNMLKQLALKQKGRRSKQIVFVIDGENVQFETVQYGDLVKVVRIPDLDFTNAMKNFEKHELIGRGNLIIILCGIYSLLKLTVCEVCTKCKCSNPLKDYSVDLKVTSEILISKALQLQECILKKTTDDQVMFGDIIPINISNHVMQTCDNNHSVRNDTLQDIYINYLNIIESYNKFVDIHCQMFGFKNLNILDALFPIKSNNVTRPLDHLYDFTEVNNKQVSFFMNKNIYKLLKIMKVDIQEMPAFAFRERKRENKEKESGILHNLLKNASKKLAKRKSNSGDTERNLLLPVITTDHLPPLVKTKPTSVLPFKNSPILNVTSSKPLRSFSRKPMGFLSTTKSNVSTSLSEIKTEEISSTKISTVASVFSSDTQTALVSPTTEPTTKSVIPAKTKPTANSFVTSVTATESKIPTKTKPATTNTPVSSNYDYQRNKSVLIYPNCSNNVPASSSSSSATITTPALADSSKSKPKPVLPKFTTADISDDDLDKSTGSLSPTTISISSFDDYLNITHEDPSKELNLKSFETVMIITNPQYAVHMEKFKSHRVQVICISSINRNNLLLAMKHRLKVETKRTLWLTHTGVFKMARYEHSHLCSSCPKPLRVIVPEDDCLKNSNFVTETRDCFKELIKEANSLLSANSSFAILPPFPPSFLTVEDASHDLYHKMDSESKMYYYTTEKILTKFKSMFSQLSKEMISFSLTEFEKQNIARQALVDYSQLVELWDFHVDVVTKKNALNHPEKNLNEKYNQWFEHINKLLSESLEPKKKRGKSTTKVSASRCQKINSNTSKKSEVASVDDFSKCCEHIIFICFCQDQVQLLPEARECSLSFSVVIFKNTSDMIENMKDWEEKLKAAVPPNKNILFIVLGSVYVLGKEVCEYYCRNGNCSDPIYYSDLVTVDIEEIAQNIICNLNQLFVDFENSSNVRCRVIYTPLIPLRCAAKPSIETIFQHERAHTTMLTADNPSLLLGGKLKWMEIGRRFLEVWHREELMLFNKEFDKETVSRFRFMIKNFFKQLALPFICWVDLIKKKIDFKENSFNTSTYQQLQIFLRNFIVSVCPSVSFLSSEQKKVENVSNYSSTFGSATPKLMDLSIRFSGPDTSTQSSSLPRKNVLTTAYQSAATKAYTQPKNIRYAAQGNVIKKDPLKRFYNDDWKDLVTFGLENSLRYLVGAIKNLKYASQPLQKKKILFISNSSSHLIDLRSRLWDILKNNRFVKKLQVIVLDEQPVTPDCYDCFLATPQILTNFHWGILCRDDIRALIVDDVMKMVDKMEDRLTLTSIFRRMNIKENSAINKVFVADFYQAYVPEYLTSLFGLTLTVITDDCKDTKPSISNVVQDFYKKDYQADRGGSELDWQAASGSSGYVTGSQKRKSSYSSGNSQMCGEYPAGSSQTCNEYPAGQRSKGYSRGSSSPKTNRYPAVDSHKSSFTYSTSDVKARLSWDDPTHKRYRSRSPNYLERRISSPDLEYRRKSPSFREHRSRSPDFRRQSNRSPIIPVHRSRSPNFSVNRSRSPGLRKHRISSPGFSDQGRRSPGFHNYDKISPGFLDHGGRSPGLLDHGRRSPDFEHCNRSPTEYQRFKSRSPTEYQRFKSRSPMRIIRSGSRNQRSRSLSRRQRSNSKSRRRRSSSTSRKRRSSSRSRRRRSRSKSNSQKSIPMARRISHYPPLKRSRSRSPARFQDRFESRSRLRSSRSRSRELTSVFQRLKPRSRSKSPSRLQLFQNKRLRARSPIDTVDNYSSALQSQRFRSRSRSKARSSSPDKGGYLDSISPESDSSLQEASFSKIDNFSVKGALDLLEQVTEKLGMLGPVVNCLTNTIKSELAAHGNNKALKIIKEEENIVLFKLIVDKLKNLIPTASLTDISMISKAIVWTTHLLEYATIAPQQEININVKAIAKASMNKPTNFTLNLIKTAFAYEGKDNPTVEEINEIFLKVCSMQFELALEED